jgi:hypothetical protein
LLMIDLRDMSKSNCDLSYGRAPEFGSCSPTTRRHTRFSLVPVRKTLSLSYRYEQIIFSLVSTGTGI